MNRYFFFLCGIFYLLMLSCSNKSEKDTIPEIGSKNDKWVLVWSDEFNYEGLPDSDKWGFEVGHARGRELQYYTYARKENIFVKDGLLTIRCIKEKYPNKFYNDAEILSKPHHEWRARNKFADYTSACITTKYKAAWLYGKIEVKAKLPQGMGVWPAIWMLGTNQDEAPWPVCGEVDIMEFIGREPENVHANVHWASTDGAHKQRGKAAEVEVPWKGFHIYGLEWNKDEMIFFYDNQEIHRVDISIPDEVMLSAYNVDVPLRSNGMEAFKNPHFLLLNFALGGAWGGDIVDDSMLPLDYQIDFVRVWQKNNH